MRFKAIRACTITIGPGKYQYLGEDQEVELPKDPKCKHLKLLSKAKGKASQEPQDLENINPLVLNAQVLTALEKLRKDNDGHWTKGGFPDMATVIEFLGRDITRAELNIVSPGFTRDSI